jgi:hypothetical protein
MGVCLAFEMAAIEKMGCWMRLLEHMIHHLADYVKLMTYWCPKDVVADVV